MKSFARQALEAAGCLLAAHHPLGVGGGAACVRGHLERVPALRVRRRRGFGRSPPAPPSNSFSWARIAGVTRARCAGVRPNSASRWRSLSISRFSTWYVTDWMRRPFGV